MLALRSAGLLYLVDPKIPAPFPINDPATEINRARFCEIVGNRLLPSDLNRIAHITEPVELLRKIDELKKTAIFCTN